MIMLKEAFNDILFKFLKGNKTNKEKKYK